MTRRRSNRGAAPVSYTDWNWITENIAQGAYPPPEAFQTFDTIVYCAMEAQPRHKAPPGKNLLRFPIDDDSYTPLPTEVVAYAHQLAQVCADHVRRNKKVLITCMMGANRSGLLTGLTIIYAYGWTGAQAASLIKRKRKPHNNVMVLGNMMFENYLKSLRAA